jgi:hypothetical protein
MARAIAFMLTVVFLTAALIQDGNESKAGTLRVPGVDNVASARLFPAHAGAGNAALALNVGDAADKAVIAKIVTWLNRAPVVGDAKHQFVSHGGSPTMLTFEFRSGDTIRIEDAIGTSTPTKLANGSIEIRSTSVPGQVTVYRDRAASRVAAPELKAWIEEGWKHEPFSLDNRSDGAAAKTPSSCQEPPRTLIWLGKTYVLQEKGTSEEPAMKLGFLRCVDDRYIAADEEKDAITVQAAPALKNGGIILITQWGRLLYVTGER